MSTTLTDQEDLPDSYDPSTVDNIRASLDENEYSKDELYAMRDFENGREDGPRSTALEEIEATLDDVTSGPSVPGDDPGPDNEPSEVDAADTETAESEDRYYRAVPEGAGGTDAGQLGVNLPSPYSDDAPAQLRLRIPRRMGFAGVFFEEAGEYNIPYAMPNDSNVQGMRVKQMLSHGTNPVVLSESDPNHPNYGDEDEE